MVEIHGSPYGAKIDNTEIDTSDSYTMAGLTISAGGQLTLPSVTTAQRDALTPATGMIVYNTDTASIQKYNGTAWENAFSWHLYKSGSTGVLASGAIYSITGLPSKRLWKLVIVAQADATDENKTMWIYLNGDSGTTNFHHKYISGTTISQEDVDSFRWIYGGANDVIHGVALIQGWKGAGNKLHVSLDAKSTVNKDGTRYLEFGGYYDNALTDLTEIDLRFANGGWTDCKYALYYQDDIEGL